LGPISGSHQGQRPLRLHRDRGNPPSENRPDTWLHPNASLKRQIPLAPRAPSIHGPSRRSLRRSNSVAFGATRSRDAVHEFSRVPHQGPELLSLFDRGPGIEAVLDGVSISQRGPRPLSAAMHPASRPAVDCRRAAGFSRACPGAASQARRHCSAVARECLGRQNRNIIARDRVAY